MVHKFYKYTHTRTHMFHECIHIYIYIFMLNAYYIYVYSEEYFVPGNNKGRDKRNKLTED